MAGKHLCAATVVVAVAAGLGGLTLEPASAQGAAFDLRTTRDLHGVCAMPNTHEMYMAALNTCWGFIEGAVQYHDAVTDRRNLKPLICYPPTATVEEGRRIFVSFGDAHKDDAKAMDEQAVVGLVRALAAKYPCPK